MCQSADGSGQAERVATVDRLNAIRSISPDGRNLIGTIGNLSNGLDIVMITMGSPSTTTPLIHSPFSEGGGMVSPDGRWIAYNSNETGRNEVYVRQFPSVDRGRWQVSVDGGVEPRWSRNSRELYFMSGGGPSPRLLWVVAVEGPSFKAGKPTLVARLSPTTSLAYDVGPDGRFLTHTTAAAVAKPGAQAQIVVVQNWFEELKSRIRATSSPQ
jgi:serine/threonine-protein kinase